ncbi:MAG: carbamoyltransferase HypF [Bacteroidales bacterium]|nr:carbamoyltransferase HypF [Bacteroidales bacterium]
METALNIHIKGVVQGVGFRPFIYRLASGAGIKGWVKNTNEGVDIFAQANRDELNAFLHQIKVNHPVAAIINTIHAMPSALADVPCFSIISSENRSLEVTGISPDIAVCDACLADMEEQPNRKHYPFVNCTNCGPRFSIIRDLPYDRETTSMSVFPMCKSCKGEYDHMLDRRFHAQPVACLDCGPGYQLSIGKKLVDGTIDQLLIIVSDLLSKGKIIAMKGIGGYHLACDASNEKAVKTLRRRKKRDAKPFAVMFRDIPSLKGYAHISDFEQHALESWRRPIVIVKKRGRTKEPALSPSISSGLNTVGAFLPSMPLHYLLFRIFPLPAIVLTSGNLSANPIVKDDDAAREQLVPIADAVLSYNREIIHRTDDSVVRIMNSKEHLIRRSRGYAPTPLHLSLKTDGILAFGAELSSCFGIGKGENAILSQYIGDLKTLDTYLYYEKEMTDFLHLFRMKPELLVCDMHPDYFSSKQALSFPGLPLIRVQHHHAHIASCMAEHGLDEKVIGVAFDGTGLGTDEKIWGGEFMVCDLSDFKRILHFDYISLPGGDRAVEEPWRTAIAYLYHVFGRDFHQLPLPFLKAVGNNRILPILKMIDLGINCPMVSSVGRLFDAVAAIINLCLESTFQAEGPMRLESIAANNCNNSYPFRIEKTIGVDETIRGVVDDVLKGVDSTLISAKFHNTIISIIVDSVMLAAQKEKLNKVVLSGGVFQNKYLTENIHMALKRSGMKVYSQEKVPANDGGIALGQLIIAAKRRTSACV